MNEKKCTRCQEIKPLAAFSGDRHSADGLNYWCRECYRSWRRLTPAEKAQHLDEKRQAREARHAPTEKRCTKCAALKPIGEFPLHGTGTAAECRRCKAARQNKHGAERFDARKAQEERAARGVRLCPRCQQERPIDQFGAYRKRPSALGAYCRTCNGEIHAEYRQRHHEKLRARAFEHVHRKRAGGVGTVTFAEFQAVCAKYDNRCLRCGATDRQLVVDHIVPLSKGGANSIDNIQPLCHPCNLSKKQKSTDYRPGKEAQGAP